MARKNSNRIFYILGALLIVVLLGAFVAKKQGWIGKDEGTEVIVAKAKKVKIVEKVSASGKVQPEVEVKISPDVSGEITELYVKEGDAITKGQLLLRIRADNYQSVVEMQTARVNTERANIAQAKARLAQVLANSAQTKLTFNRNADLYKQKVISQADYEASKAAYDVSRQEIESAKQSVRAAEFSLQSSVASLGESRKNLNKTTIYAPVSGTISKLSVEKGERVVGTSQMAGTELLRIANLNTMEVRVNVNENDIIRVNVGDSAIVEVDSYSSKDEKFRGIVTEIANTAKDANTLEAVTEFEVRIRLLNDSYKHLSTPKSTPFRPGMTASVDIITEQKSNVVSVPISAVTTRAPENDKKDKKIPSAPKPEENGKAVANKKGEVLQEVVFVHNKGIVKLVNVKTGISDFDNIEILSGLKDGDEVVSGPFRAVSKQLKDKAKVIVKDEATLAKAASDDKDKKEEDVDL